MPANTPHSSSSRRVHSIDSRGRTISLRSSTAGIEDRRDEAVVEVAQALHELARGRLDRDDLHVGLVLLQVLARRPSACRSCRGRRRTRRPRGSRAGSRGRCPRSARAGSPGCRTGTGTRSVGSSAAIFSAMRIAPLLPSSPGDERDLGAEDLEQLAALDRHVLGHHDAQLVAAQLGDEREPDAGVARRRFEDRRARARARRRASASSIILSAMRSFDEPPGFWPSSLAQMRTSGFGRQLVHADERGVADQPEDVSSSARAHAPPATAGRIERTSPSATLVSRPSR